MASFEKLEMQKLMIFDKLNNVTAGEIVQTKIKKHIRNTAHT